MFATCLMCILLGTTGRRYRDNRAAVEVAQQHNGFIFYQDDLKADLTLNKASVDRILQPGNIHHRYDLRTRLSPIHRCDLNCSKLSAEDWETLARINSIRHLALYQASEKDICYLNSFPRLEYLALIDCEYSIDSSLLSQQISQMRSLVRLTIHNSHVSPQIFEAICCVTQLRQLKLSETSLQGLRLDALQNLPNLEVLDLPSASINDFHLSSIGKIEKLTELSLGSNLITDDGISFLKDLSHLEWLDLSENNLSDQSATILAECSNLQWLNISGTAISPQSCQILKSQLSGCNVKD